MNDERFDRDLGTVLREIAGEEAPMSLRNRLARISDEAPLGRRMWFTPPLRLATVAAVLVAVVALAIIFVPRETVGPGPSDSPEPSAPMSASSEPMPSMQPTVEPTPEVGAWTGLQWSAGVTPFAPNTSWIADIVWWGDGYIGVGGTFSSTGPGLGTVFSSTDGLHWNVAYQAELPTDWAFEHVVPLGSGLLAVSNQRGVACEGDAPCPPEGFDVAPRLWYSSNGADWSPIDSQSWRDSLGDGVPFAVVGGRDGVGSGGVVAVLYDGVVLHSIDGQTWQRAELPASEMAIPKDVSAFSGGFVIVGRDGQPDPHSQVTVTPPIPGVGRPAAWVSANGIDWVEAAVEGDAVAGGELRDVAAGANGLFAAGIAEAVDTKVHPPTHGWASADGLTWSIAGRIGEHLPLFGGALFAQVLVGDGSRMVIFGPESTESNTTLAFISTDGIDWAPLAFGGVQTDFHIPFLAVEPQGVRYLTSADLMPTGVIAHVYSGDNELWFGAGEIAPAN